jgi:hypothetical protein
LADENFIYKRAQEAGGIMAGEDFIYRRVREAGGTMAGKNFIMQGHDDEQQIRAGLRERNSGNSRKGRKRSK